MKASAHFAMVLLATVSLATGCHTEPTEVPDRPQAVTAVRPRVGPVVEGSSFLGELVPERSVRVIAQVPGTAVDLDVSEGDAAPAGTALVHVAAPDVAARVERVRAERGRAEAERDFVCTQLETDRVLGEAGDLPPVQLASSERACASAERAVEAALAAEREAGVARARSVERAPFDGVVLAHLVDPGQTVMPGTPLVLFGSEKAVLRVRLPQAAAAELAVGTRALTELGSGRVTEIAAQAVGPARLVEVVVSLDVPAVDARMGTTWTVTLVSEEWPDAVSVPAEALGEEGDERFVYLVGGDRLRRQVVLPGPRQEGWVAVDPPLPADSLVVSGGVEGLDSSRPVLAVVP